MACATAYAFKATFAIRTAAVMAAIAPAMPTISPVLSLAQSDIEVKAGISFSTIGMTASPMDSLTSSIRIFRPSMRPAVVSAAAAA